MINDETKVKELIHAAFNAVVPGIPVTFDMYNAALFSLNEAVEKMIAKKLGETDDK